MENHFIDSESRQSITFWLSQLSNKGLRILEEQYLGSYTHFAYPIRGKDSLEVLVLYNVSIFVDESQLY